MNPSRKMVSILLLSVAWIALTILTVTWGVQFDWSDNAHVNYGFPWAWATHTLSTIAGPADIWAINLSALIIDLLFWLGLMVVATALMLNIFNKK
jgi:hypothetical protein